MHPPRPPPTPPSVAGARRCGAPRRCHRVSPCTNPRGAPSAALGCSGAGAAELPATGKPRRHGGALCQDHPLAPGRQHRGPDPGPASALARSPGTRRRPGPAPSDLKRHRQRRRRRGGVSAPAQPGPDLAPCRGCPARRLSPPCSPAAAATFPRPCLGSANIAQARGAAPALSSTAGAAGPRCRQGSKARRGRSCGAARGPTRARSHPAGAAARGWG